MMKTIFCDIDGCILVHPKNYLSTYKTEPKYIPGSKEKLFEWYCLGYIIILTTGRPDHEAQKLKDMFARDGIFFHQLITNCGAGPRYLINDIDPLYSTNAKAIGINIKRNKGLSTLILVDEVLKSNDN